MARNTERAEIDGIGFEVTQLGMARGRAMFVRLAKALGPALAVALEGAPAGANALAPALAKALDGLSDEDLTAALADLATVTRYAPGGLGSSKWPVLDAANQEELFAGRMLLLVRFLAFALRVQFADFFAVLAPPGAGAAPDPGTPKP